MGLRCWIQSQNSLHFTKQFQTWGPETSQKLTKLKLWYNLTYFKCFYFNVQPTKAFSDKLRPAEQMWPSNNFDFKTLGLQCVSPILASLTRLNIVMVVWFQAGANFHYCPSFLKNWHFIQKWSKMTQKLSLLLP